MSIPVSLAVWLVLCLAVRDLRSAAIRLGDTVAFTPVREKSREVYTSYLQILTPPSQLHAEHEGAAYQVGLSLLTPLTAQHEETAQQVYCIRAWLSAF